MDKPVRVLLADDNRDLIQVLKDYIESQEDMELVGVAHNGSEALELIFQESPDVIVLDMIMPHLDGLGVLEELQFEKQRPRVIILSAFGQESVTGQAHTLGADYYIKKPFDLAILGKRIQEVCRDHAFTSSPGPRVTNSAIVQGVSVIAETPVKNWEVEVTHMIQQMGVPAHVKGYQYLRDAIVSVMQEASLLDAVTRGLYPMIAKKYFIHPSRVERGIRHAIEIAWDRGNVEFRDRLFGYTVSLDRGKPTNSEFIAIVADTLRMSKSS